MTDVAEGRWRGRAILLATGLVAGNLLAWAWALAVFRGRPDLLGVCAVIYGLGLRHALDADHIAAVDNVTRSLMRRGQRPVTVGASFALGHSLVVFLVTALVTWGASSLPAFGRLQESGRLASRLASTAFLLMAGFGNAWALAAELRSSRIETSRRLSPLLGLVRSSWQMGLLGVVFGLGFETATEVAMFGLSASEAARGAAFARVAVLPMIFAAAMTTLDGANGLMVMRACAWSLDRPERARRYNLIVTGLSVAAGLGVGSLQLADLASGWLRAPWLRLAAGAFSDHSSAVGLGVALAFALCLAASLIARALARFRRALPNLQANEA